jgi:hypothetical protein
VRSFKLIDNMDPEFERMMAQAQARQAAQQPRGDGTTPDK